MKKKRIPGSNGMKKNIRRTIERVTWQQRASAENVAFYQNGREWTMDHDEKAIARRRAAIAAQVPVASFVPGIIRKGSIFDVTN